MNNSLRFLLALVLTVSCAAPAFAQAPAEPAPASGAAAAQDDDPDRDPNDAQPDFYVATLNTNLRLPKGKMAFRLTHRFLRTLGDGDFGDLAARAFGFDSGAQIGVELKYAPFSGAQLGVYRTSDRTIQFQGQYNAIKDGNGPIGIGVVVNVDGTNNFSDEFSPGAAIVLSRELGERGAIYLQPSYVGNTNLISDDGDDYTMMAGIGARLRAARNTYLFVEGSPRLAGYKQGVTMISFGFEQRAGGHLFQLNVSNGFGTTLAQVARGGTAKDDWYLGFNLSRKFFLMTTAIWKGLAAAVVAAATAVACGGGGGSSTPTSPTPPTTTTPTTPTTPTGPNPSTATITIGTDGRVTPASVTIAPGGRVTMINNHNQPHDMSSDPHPEHSLCPELNQWGFLTSGQQRTSGNLNTARTCGFHDHNLPDNTGLQGRVIIQ